MRRTLPRQVMIPLARKLAGYCQHTLTRLGYVYVNRSDDVFWPVRFHVDYARLAELANGAPAIELPIDVHRLPRRVKAMDLTGEGVLHEISTALGGLPVEACNTAGVSYLIGLEPKGGSSQADDLPKQVELDLTERPAGDYMVPLGEGTDGPVWHHLHDLGHTLITGTTGSGKSTWIHAALAALLTGSRPDRLRLALVDPKRLEFAVWEGVPHLMADVAHDAGQATDLVAGLAAEMDRRGDIMAAELVRDLQGYNAKRPEAPLPAILLIVDEAIDLVTEAGVRSELVGYMTRLTSKARATGIYVWLAAQHPRFDVLPRTVTTNLSTRLAFRVRDADAARLAGVPGAHQIPRNRPGRLLARLDGDPVALQGYYLPDEKLQQVARNLGGGSARQVLTDDERRVAEIALHDLSGAFRIDDIYGCTGPKSKGGVSRRWLVNTAKKWEQRGWLSRDPSDPTKPRVVTEALRDVLARSDDR